MNIVKEIRKIQKMAAKLQRLAHFRPARMVFAHPDLCIYARRDIYRVLGSRYLVKKGQRRGFLVVSLLWLSATIRW